VVVASVVVAGKIFKLTQPMSLANIALKLNGYHVEENYEEGDYKFRLITEVVGLETKNGVVTGVYSSDSILHIFHRGTSAPLPQTVEATFSFAHVQETTFLTVVEKKRVANFVANKLSEVLFEKVGVVVVAKILPETLKAFHDKNPEETKIIFFDNVDIPNVEKLSLYGPDLNNTSLFGDYMKHGNLWYVVGRSKDMGYVVGITRDASVTIFNLADKTKFVKYVAKEIFPIILQATK
jgi:hypothetical protein